MIAHLAGGWDAVRWTMRMGGGTGSAFSAQFRSAGKDLECRSGLI
jgi:hypothetical protein